MQQALNLWNTAQYRGGAPIMEKKAPLGIKILIVGIISLVVGLYVLFFLGII